jgi:hypothetical protein
MLGKELSALRMNQSKIPTLKNEAVKKTVRKNEVFHSLKLVN